MEALTVGLSSSLKTTHFPPNIISCNLLKSPVVVMRNPFDEVHLRPRHAAYGPVPAIPYPHVQISCVEIFKILIKRNKVLEKTMRDREDASGVCDTLTPFSNVFVSVAKERGWIR